MCFNKKNNNNNSSTKMYIRTINGIRYRLSRLELINNQKRRKSKMVICLAFLNFVVKFKNKDFLCVFPRFVLLNIYIYVCVCIKQSILMHSLMTLSIRCSVVQWSFRFRLFSFFDFVSLEILTQLWVLEISTTITIIKKRKNRNDLFFS